MGSFFTKTDKTKVFRIYTFGDSVLDCGKYNRYDIHPAKLILENNDELFPEFKGKDLKTLLDCEIELIHLAIDGSMVSTLMRALKNFEKYKEDNEDKEVTACALLSIGGNDCLDGLIRKYDSEIDCFEEQLRKFLDLLPIKPVFISTIYDPTNGDDSLNFLGGDVKTNRINHDKINNLLKKIGDEYGGYVDTYEHFLKNGSLEWFCNVIEPSEKGISEIRRLFLDKILDYINKKS